MKTSLLVALEAGGQATFEQTTSVFPSFFFPLFHISLWSFFYVFSLSLSLSSSFILASAEEGCLQP
jgi:hypothetical protein